MTTRTEIEKQLLGLAPLWLAEEWDSSGLQIAFNDEDVTTVMVALEVTSRVIREASQLKCQMVITHHPLIYKPLSGLKAQDPVSRHVYDLCRNNLDLLCLHTNFDNAQHGLNDYLAGKLGLQEVRVLAAKREKYFKLVVFIPRGYEDKVREAMCGAGAGWIGNYSFCTFQTEGTGTFRPLEGAKPFLGEQGKLEKTNEYRLETIVKEGQIGEVLNAMRDAHPYEEVAYDLYPLANPIENHGLGRVGKLPSPMAWKEFLGFCEKSLKVEDMRWQNHAMGEVSSVAICGGKGNSLIPAARQAGADVYITGDINHHDWILGGEIGLPLIDAGHGGLEKWFVTQVAEYLARQFSDLKIYKDKGEKLWFGWGASK